jgi:basic membrane lipoprotein Med (substrate-binding protein (PBP1-ABC) superfamily)
MARLRLGYLGLLLLLVANTPLLSAGQLTKVGLVTDIGKVDDRTFNEFAYKGLLRAVKEFALTSAFIETQQTADYEKNIAQFATEGYDMIITVGFMLGEATRKMAVQYPHIRFAIVDYTYTPPVPNILGLMFAEDQAGFLAGALAGLMTQSKTVGMVAGVEIPPVIRFRKGYEAGVKHVCPSCTVLGVYIDSFTDPARGKTAALSQIDEGADVIFGGGGITGSGAILGATQAGKWAIGVDQDEYETTFKQGRVTGAHKLLSSAMKRVDNAVYGAVKLAVEGMFTGGTSVFDAKNDGIGLAPFHATESAVPETVRTRLREIAAGLKAGTLSTGVR